MLITGIELHDHASLPGMGAHRAAVTLRTDAGGISLFATARLSGNPAPCTVARALVDDALRQVRRLPEHRRMPGKVALGPGAAGPPQIA